MKSFLLLILSLMTGCVASLNVMGCQEGWVEFTCNYPNPRTRYNRVIVERQDEKLILSSAKNEWKNEGNFFLFHDTKMNTLNVTIKRLKPEDEGEYECQFKKSRRIHKVDVKVEINRCQKPFIHKASTKTNITCNYPVNDMSNDMLSDMFFCKEKDFTCEDILTTKSPLKSIERFILTETDSDFTISISHVSPSDTGVYWCGVKTESYRAALRRIQLEVRATSAPPVFSSTQSTPTSPSAQNKARRSPLIIIIAVVVCAILLGLVLILVFIYKRIQHSKYTRGEEAQNNKEDRTYEEIQERPQEPDSGTAIKTIYTTANFPTNPSPDINYYSNSSFKNSSVEVSAGDPYSTVNDNDQHPTYSTVNHPSGLPEDPCYSTLNKPQQP